MNNVQSEMRSRHERWKGGFGSGIDAGAAPELGRPGARRHAIERSQRSAHGLGWFSIGLGLAELLAPRTLGRAIGVGDGFRHRGTLRAMGFRELAAGTAILSRRRPATWLWARVAGDLMDLSLLVLAMTGRRKRRARVIGALGAVAGVTVIDYLTARQLQRTGVRRLEPNIARRIQVTKTMTVRASVEEVYRFWRDFQNLPRFMAHLQSVVVQGDRRSRWTAKGPGGKTVSWEAEITADRPNERIAWQSLPGADVPNRGQVLFLPAPGGRGTELRVDLEYDPPAGIFGATLAKLLGREPGEQIEGDLRRFKQVMEVGEVTNSDASIHRGMHAAQPPREVPAAVRARLNGGGR
jgi:uncharacterized membrane protein